MGDAQSRRSLVRNEKVMSDVTGNYRTRYSMVV